MYFRTMTTRAQVLERLRTSKPELFQRFPIKELALFGSVSRGDDTPESDVDLLVEFNAPVGMEFIHLAHALKEMLGRNVDLVSKGGIKPGYFEAIRGELVHV